MCKAVPTRWHLMPTLCEVRSILKDGIGTTRHNPVQRIVPPQKSDLRRGGVGGGGVPHSRGPRSMTIKNSMFEVLEDRWHHSTCTQYSKKASTLRRPDPSSGSLDSTSFLSWRSIVMPLMLSWGGFARTLLLINTSDALEMKALKCLHPYYSQYAVPWSTLPQAHPLSWCNILLSLVCLRKSLHVPR